MTSLLLQVDANIPSLLFIQGDAFGFMKLCAFIITELKNLSAASRASQNPQLQQQQQHGGQGGQAR